MSTQFKRVCDAHDAKVSIETSVICQVLRKEKFHSYIPTPILISAWPRGVTASTMDSESNDRGSNLREAFTRFCANSLAFPRYFHYLKFVSYRAGQLIA